MSAAKYSVNHSALLRNLTFFHTVTPNVRRRSGKSLTLTRIVRVRGDIFQASSDENGSIPIGMRTLYFNKVERSSVMLSEINEVTKTLQIRYRTRPACRGYNDLLESCARAMNVSEALLLNCTLVEQYLLIDPHIL